MTRPWIAEADEDVLKRLDALAVMDAADAEIKLWAAWARRRAETYGETLGDALQDLIDGIEGLDHTVLWLLCCDAADHEATGEWES